jgi:hypothetical protein
MEELALAPSALTAEEQRSPQWASAQPAPCYSGAADGKQPCGEES